MWLGNIGIWAFGWIRCRFFDLFSSFMEGYVILKFYLRIFFSVFHSGQILLYAGWSPSQFAHFVSFWHSWSSCPGCPHFAHFCSFLQNLLLWPYFWQLKHRWGLGIYTFVFRMRKPTFISLGISCPFIVKIYESAGINRPSFRLFILSTSVTPCDCNSFWISSSSMPASSLHQITHLEYFSVLWGVTLTGMLFNLSVL